MIFFLSSLADPHTLYSCLPVNLDAYQKRGAQGT